MANDPSKEVNKSIEKYQQKIQWAEQAMKEVQ